MGFATVTVFPSVRITSVSAPYTGMDMWKNLSEVLGTSELCLVHTLLSSADGIIVYRSWTQIVTSVQYNAIQYNHASLCNL